MAIILFSPEISAEWFMSGSRQQRPLFPRDYTGKAEDKTFFHTGCTQIRLNNNKYMKKKNEYYKKIQSDQTKYTKIRLGSFFHVITQPQGRQKTKKFHTGCTQIRLNNNKYMKKKNKY